MDSFGYIIEIKFTTTNYCRSIYMTCCLLVIVIICVVIFLESAAIQNFYSVSIPLCHRLYVTVLHVSIFVEQTCYISLFQMLGRTILCDSAIAKFIQRTVFISLHK